MSPSGWLRVFWHCALVYQCSRTIGLKNRVCPFASLQLQFASPQVFKPIGSWIKSARVFWHCALVFQCTRVFRTENTDLAFHQSLRLWRLYPSGWSIRVFCHCALDFQCSGTVGLNFRACPFTSLYLHFYWSEGGIICRAEILLVRIGGLSR